MFSIYYLQGDGQCVGQTGVRLVRSRGRVESGNDVMLARTSYTGARLRTIYMSNNTTPLMHTSMFSNSLVVLFSLLVKLFVQLSFSLFQ